MLKFLGLGSAFNTHLGNTSAFIKDGNSMVLIDCGGTVFHRLNELMLLKNVQNLHVIITHTHPDHVGSLGEVIFYAYYILKIKVKLYYPDEVLMRTFLTCVGVEEQMVELISNESIHFHDNDLGEWKVTFVSVPHLNTVKSYGLMINIKKDNQQTNLYYSGDSNEIPNQLLVNLMDGQIDYFYQDTCGIDYEGNGHLYLNKLVNLIPRSYRYKVYCIHHDSHLDIHKVKELGFKVPELYK